MRRHGYSRFRAWFNLQQAHTSLSTEALAALTTFLTMAYILPVNAQILSNAIFLEQPQDLQAELVIATAVSAAVASILMGIWANYPIALAPGMGINAFFAFAVVGQMGLPWPLALSAVLLEGMVFVLLTLTGVRSLIVNMIPMSLKVAIAAGVGLFIAYIGLSNAGIIIADAATKTKLTTFPTWPPILAALGILLTTFLCAKGMRGAIFWGVMITALAAWLVGAAPWPTGLIQWPQWPSHLFGQALVGFGQLQPQQLGSFLLVTLVLLFTDMFDTVGTLSAVGVQAGFLNQQGHFPRALGALMADAVGTIVGALFGTSTVTTYIESAAGIAVGGRTGLTALMVGGLFLLSLLFLPITTAIPSFATAPALVLVGVFMARSLPDIPWSDLTEAIPAFLVVLVMPLSYSISEGLAVGFISYPIVKWAAGKGKEVHPALWGLAVIFIAHYFWR
ncbi:MAG TPA: NCS2 family permease [Thermosynechococcus sp. M98_K2018_005]|nr:NCS2 family permease [Thermosynechococcus sp. M98_K2018_005]HIK47346.1 NCS2 family permease [Thermosynechococcus sp. M55_K2018_012]